MSVSEQVAEDQQHIEAFLARRAKGCLISIRGRVDVAQNGKFHGRSTVETKGLCRRRRRNLGASGRMAISRRRNFTPVEFEVSVGAGFDRQIFRSRERRSRKGPIDFRV